MPVAPLGKHPGGDHTVGNLRLCCASVAGCPRPNHDLCAIGRNADFFFAFFVRAWMQFLLTTDSASLLRSRDHRARQWFEANTIHC